MRTGRLFRPHTVNTLRFWYCSRRITIPKLRAHGAGNLFVALVLKLSAMVVSEYRFGTYLLLDVHTMRT